LFSGWKYDRVTNLRSPPPSNPGVEMQSAEWNGPTTPYSGEQGDWEGHPEERPSVASNGSE